MLSLSLSPGGLEWNEILRSFVVHVYRARECFDLARPIPLLSSLSTVPRQFARVAETGERRYELLSCRNSV